MTHRPKVLQTLGKPRFVAVDAVTSYQASLNALCCAPRRSEETMTQLESAPDTTRLVRRLDDVPPDRRRGGEIRTLLSPRSVGSTSGFMGVASIAPGDCIAQHYHPYSEEFVYVVAGGIVAELDGEAVELPERHGLLIPIGVRHRLANRGKQEASIVFHLGPLAPRPELGHVDTEGEMRRRSARPHAPR
jgi:putative monooxygenase